MRTRRSLMAALLAGLFALGAVACEADDTTGEDPLIDDGTGTDDTFDDGLGDDADADF